MMTVLIVIMAAIAYTVIAVGVYSFLEARQIAPYDLRPIIGFLWPIMPFALALSWLAMISLFPAIVWLDKKFQARFRK